MGAGPRLPGDRGALSSTRLTALLLFGLSLAAYANNFQHEYLLDDGYTLLGNPHVRSLGETPRYFVDPSTYTSLREQVDYRPVLQVTYALNYWMGGYETWWWHLTQIVLHAIVGLAIYLITRRILLLLGDPAPGGIALLAGVIFVIHPASSGVVNYLNARSSLLTAAFLAPAIVAIMKPIEDPDYGRPPLAATLLYTIALFTKVEAIGALGVFWAYELWMRGRESGGASFLADARRTLDRRTLRRMGPALAVTVVYLGIRWTLMSGYDFAEARHAADVGPPTYLMTQVTAWWHYVFRWIAPVRLIADNATYPVIRSPLEPAFLLALGGWLLVATVAVSLWRRAPWILFLLISALALLAPTSSVAPLAEMVNEHRPYLAMGILSLALLIPAGWALRRVPRGAFRRAAYAGVAVVLVALAGLTRERNEAFATSAAYWSDILGKAPSARAHLNYGLTRMTAGDMDDALRHFELARETAPNWYILHINMGVAKSSLGRLDEARAHYDRAVELDRFSGMALAYRGEFRLAQGEYGPAREDFERALPVHLDRYRNERGLAMAWAGLGDVERSYAHTERMLELDPARAPSDIPAVSTPYFRDPGLREAGIRYYERLSARLPDAGWIRENIARLSAPRGQETAGTEPRAAPADEPEAALMKAGLELLYTTNDPAAAAERFREVLAGNPTHYGAHYQLATALDRLGRRDEARPLWEEVLRMAGEYRDPATAATARSRLAQD